MFSKTHILHFSYIPEPSENCNALMSLETFCTFKIYYANFVQQ